MKLRMAKNSLFAILLRSPWWISFVIATVITLAALAIFPARFVPYAIPAGFPFLIVGTIALYRQARVPSAAKVARTTAILRTMSWPEFAEVVEQGFRQRGYEVSRLQQGPADFELKQGTSHVLVACKRWKAASHSVEALRELHAAANARGARECIYIAINAPSGSALVFARENNIDLLEDTALVQLAGSVINKR